jgi:hypothetical protein
VAVLAGQRLDPDLALISGTDRLPPTFPPYQLHVIPELRVPSVDLRLAPELSLVGARSASQSNNLRSTESYRLPPYVMLSASVSAPTLHLRPGYTTSVAVRATDLLESQGDEPGYGGIDYPALGRRVWLTATQEF